MKKKFIESTIIKIKKKQEVSELQEKRYRYGLEGFYNLFTKLVALTIISILLNTFVEFILLTITYSLYRLYGFGIHAKTSLQCWFTTLPIYITGCLFIKYGSISNIVSISLWIIGFISFLLFAPADTPARPLIHKDKRIRAKILSLIILTVLAILYYCCSFIIIKNTLIYSLLMEVISINPLTYKIFHTPFNNYKTYQITV